MNCLYYVFAFDLETCIVEYSEDFESFAAGVRHPNNLDLYVKSNLNKEELVIERSKVHVLYGENGKSVLKVIEYGINKYEGKPKYVIIKHGNRRFSPYKYQMVGHNASGFDKYIVMSSLPSSYKGIKTIEIPRGLTKQSNKIGSVIEDDRKVPKYVKLVCPKSYKSGSLKSIQKEYNIQPDLVKGEIYHDLINFGNCKDYKNLWRPFIIDDLLGLAYIIAKHSNSIRKITGISYKNSLTEATLGWYCLERYLKENIEILFTPKNKYVRDFLKQTVHGSRVLARKKSLFQNRLKML